MVSSATISAPVEQLSQHAVNGTDSRRAGASTYWPQLDGLRTLAFSLVFLFHAGIIQQIGSRNTILEAFNCVICSGLIGVDLFLSLAAF